MRTEQSKYTTMWDHAAYRRVAPGESHVEQFLRLYRPAPDHVLCDFGAGTGRAALRLARDTGLPVTCLDFAANSLDAEVRAQLGERLRFRQHDLTTPVGEKFDAGFCTDVLEHIKPSEVDCVLANIFTAARKVYLAISTVPDVMGSVIGEPLHLTVESPFWWHDKLESLGFRIDWSHYQDGVVCFYGSAYANGQDFSDRGGLNVEESRIKANIIANLALGLQEIAPHEAQDTVIYLLAGGPSLSDFETGIIEAGRSGTPIVTVNGTYNWLIDRGIRPAAQVMVDARTSHRRFVTRTVDTCKYLISSQCDNEILRSLPANQTYLWHSGESEIAKQAVEEYAEANNQKREWYPVHGGSTVVSRAITLLAMLGFRKIEVFGWDSCLRDNAHHAYNQPENDGGPVFDIKVGGRTFRCNPWMVVQANELDKLVRHIWSHVDGLDIEVHGDGLIAHMFNHAASLAEKEE